MESKIKAFSLSHTPSLIEILWPVGKISIESFKERKSGTGQTLTNLGSYWKGRKPLFLVRACILASLLPYTGNAKKDLDILEKLLGIDNNSFLKRVKKKSDISSINKLSYAKKIDKCYRIEEIPSHLSKEDWTDINSHCKTHATSIECLIEQLGIMRFGHKVKVSDPFCGSGSIPFEAARMGCDVFASDLNPIACMLTWGSLNIVGASPKQFQKIYHNIKKLISQIEIKMTDLSIELSQNGDQAKNYLYCLETQCPETGWLVPIIPNFIISKKRKIIIRIIPDYQNQKYDIRIINNVSDDDLKNAEDQRTMKKGRLFHPINKNKMGIALSNIRGDYKTSDGLRKNNLRAWQKTDFQSHKDDIFQERLYCIEWIKKSSLTKSRLETFFEAATQYDLENEKKVKDYIVKNIVAWQKAGFIPEMSIEDGKETSRLKWERGWTYWHHLFSSRQLFLCALFGEKIKLQQSPENLLFFARLLNISCKLCIWNAARETVSPLFCNQTLNTLFSYAVPSWHSSLKYFESHLKNFPIPINFTIQNIAANKINSISDIYITDPPYADAVQYHEITEYFIAWLKNLTTTSPFNEWTWDSRRSLAIQGNGKEFCTRMIETYKIMTEHMPDNGIQIVMFTHQSSKIWSDIVRIFWGAELQVVADWYIATETSSGLKKGGYIQGTHIIILKKRKGEVSAYSDEIIQKIKKEVAYQMETMTGLNQTLKGNGHMENLFTDIDLQMAGYAAALRVLTQYTKIDGKNMIKEALRPTDQKKRSMIDELIELSVQIANEYFVPQGMNTQTWERRKASERFYLKMLDIESKGIYKLDNYQNFAKAFRIADYTSLMIKLNSNHACLKNAKNFNKEIMSHDNEFGSSLTRSILFSLWQMSENFDDKIVLDNLRNIVINYMENREDLQIIAHYISLKTKNTYDIATQKHAFILSQLIKNERIVSL